MGSIIFKICGLSFNSEFRANCGTGTTSRKANIFQQLAEMRGDIFYKILLDLHKTYGTMEQDICLYILDRYGITPWYLQLLRQYWGSMVIVVR